MVVSGSILKRFKIILKRSMKSFVINSLDFVKSKFLSSLICFRLFMTSDWSAMVPTNVLRTYPSTRLQV